MRCCNEYPAQGGMAYLLAAACSILPAVRRAPSSCHHLFQPSRPTHRSGGLASEWRPKWISPVVLPPTIRGSIFSRSPYLRVMVQQQVQLYVQAHWHVSTGTHAGRTCSDQTLLTCPTGSRWRWAPASCGLRGAGAQGQLFVPALLSSSAAAAGSPLFRPNQQKHHSHILYRGPSPTGGHQEVAAQRLDVCGAVGAELARVQQHQRARLRSESFINLGGQEGWVCCGKRI